MRSAEQTEQLAAEWLARRDSGNWSESDQAAMHQWLNESTANMVAFVRLQSAWSRADRFRALGAGLPRGEVPTPEEFSLSPFFSGQRNEAQRNDSAAGRPASSDEIRRPRRGRRLTQAVAASVAIALIVTIACLYWPVGPRYRTPIGVTEAVPMADGSKVMLNTDSAIRISITEHERAVSLDQGEAFFEVAHDPSRPFVVSAGNKRVVAVGTKFSVRRIGDDIRVFVTEGKVRVEESEHTFLSLPGGKKEAKDKATNHFSLSIRETVEQFDGAANEGTPREFFVAAGGVARTDADGILVQEEPLAEVEESLSWRTGYLVFHESTLADAVAEFNRYSERKILIKDPDIAGIRLSGSFRTTDADAFVRLLEDGFSLHALPSSDSIVLTKP